MHDVQIFKCLFLFVSFYIKHDFSPYNTCLFPSLPAKKGFLFVCLFVFIGSRKVLNSQLFLEVGKSDNIGSALAQCVGWLELGSSYSVEEKLTLSCLSLSPSHSTVSPCQLHSLTFPACKCPGGIYICNP